MAEKSSDGKTTVVENLEIEVKNQGNANRGWVLHNSDQPGMSLAVSQLNGLNYLSCSLAVKTALEAKDKLGFVDGSFKQPEDPVEYKRWKPVDSMVKSWITNSLTKDLSESFMFCNTAKELWDNIAERIKPVPRCICGSCTCLVNKRLEEHDSDIKLVQFLMGLHLMYDAIRGQILNLDPLPSVNKAFSMVVKQETQKEVNLAFNNVESSAMMAKAGGRKLEDKKNAKAGKYCDHCNQNGHTREACFKLIGFPDWFKELKEQRKKAAKKGGSVAINMVADTPMDTLKEKDNIDFAGVLTALQEIAKVVKNKAEEQDQRTNKPLIEGKVAGSLYVLKQAKTVETIRNSIANAKLFACNDVAQNTISDVTLWHHRLGHAAMDTIKHIDSINFNSENITGDLDEIETRMGEDISVAETPIESHKDKNSLDYANVLAAIQELTKAVRGKPEEQHVNFANLGEFAGTSGKINYTPPTDTSWIVDTGASSHMCFNKNLLINLRVLESVIPVHLPDGSVQNVEYTRSVVIQRKIHQHNVFFLPNFKYNLLLLNKLVKHNGVSVMFNASSCVIQDQKTKETMVEARLLDNLYILKHECENMCNIDKHVETVNSVGSTNSSHIRNNCLANSTCLLWHQRLGHAPIDVLRHIDDINVNSSSVLPEVCDVCHYAKQHKMPFPITGSRNDQDSSEREEEVNIEEIDTREDELLEEDTSEVRHWDKTLATSRFWEGQ
ncbi:uncharacterized protein G2W53_014538 [Senna tora]|uniref:GAG-pre-integrase domain-containing protein n=1 Tax=Senna tora TaxID=362788 RepID=A0A834WTP1_9FABA|nr:uncharacterized protein G2W53_014538 [Senna tora]